MLDENSSIHYRTIFEENLLPEDQITEKHIKTFLDIMILAILNGKSTYGYKIIATIHDEFGILLSPATLYPLLHILEKNKLIEPNINKGKTIYCLTPKGRETFGRKLTAFNLSTQLMKNFVRTYGKI